MLPFAPGPLYTYPIDWWRLIVELERSGISNRKLAHLIGMGVTRDQIQRVKNRDALPNVYVGAGIVLQHMRMCSCATAT